MMLSRLLVVLLLIPLHAAERKTVWDGAYTDAQAERGRSAYEYSCSRCHGENMAGSGNVLRGARFLEQWREDSVKSFFDVLKATMPRGAAKSLGDGEYLDIVAYILRANGFPAGAEELTTANIERVLITGKEGPKPVPDFALVRTIGCLAQSPPGTWILKEAAEPVRTRVPREPEAPEGDLSPGTHTFRLLDALSFQSKLQDGRRMEARGFLIRTPDDERINLTWLEEITSSGRCGSSARP